MSTSDERPPWLDANNEPDAPTEPTVNAEQTQYGAEPGLEPTTTHETTMVNAQADQGAFSPELGVVDEEQSHPTTDLQDAYVPQPEIRQPERHPWDLDDPDETEEEIEETKSSRFGKRKPKSKPKPEDNPELERSKRKPKSKKAKESRSIRKAKPEKMPTLRESDIFKDTEPEQGFLKRLFAHKPKRSKKFPIRDGNISVLDGTTTTIIEIKKRDPVAVYETKYDSEVDAIEDAMTRKGVVVWANGGLVAEPSDDSLQKPDWEEGLKAQITDARSVEHNYGKGYAATRSGQVLFVSQDVNLLRLCAKRKVYLSACSVGDLDQPESYWMRIGVSQSELSLVNDGRIVRWSALSQSVSEAERRIHALGHDPVEVVKDLAETVAQEASNKINEWALQRRAGATLFLHGPGAGWTNLDAKLRSGSSCRVLPAPRSWGSVGMEQGAGQLSTALHSVQHSPVVSTQSIITKAKRRVQLRNARRLVFYLILFGAMFFGWKAQQTSIQERINVAAEQEELAFQHRDNALHELSAAATEIATLQETLDNQIQYPWEQVAWYKLTDDTNREQDDSPQTQVSVEKCEPISTTVYPETIEEIHNAYQLAEVRAGLAFREGAVAVRTSDIVTRIDFDEEGFDPVSFEMRSLECHEEELAASEDS